MTHSTPSICRNCLAYCPIVVTVENGRAVKVTGDREAPLFEGYTCPKGRALPAQHNDPERLLECLRRDDSVDSGGGFRPVASSDAITDIASRVEAILARDGPRSIAMYAGTGVVSHPMGPPMAKAFFRAIASPMVFSAATIDKPAANTSTALHGNWVAGAQTFETSDVWMIVGANPVIAKSNGAPSNNPGQRLKDAARRGLKLIVIDPRCTETAKRAHAHLQCWPGEDSAILAAMIRVIIAEGMVDTAFVTQNSSGLNELWQAVAPFTPDYAAARAGVSVDSLLDAARVFGRGRRGGVVCSTGPSFSGNSNLSYYLALCLNTICGRWAREGDEAPYPNVLLPAFAPKAQPYPPYGVFGSNAMRVLDLRENASGMPTAALADEILQPGKGRVRALFCLGGNPLLSWPDQEKTARAMRDLELLVVFDYRMTATAKFAHYVIPPPLSLELPGTTQFAEALKYNGVSRGFDVPWAQYTQAVVAPPPGSDVIDEAEFFFRLAQRMHLQLDWINVRGYGPHLEQPKESVPFDMSRVPTTEELIGLGCKGSRVSLDEVKQHSHGRVFQEARVRVQVRDADCSARLELADPLMMVNLAALAREPARPESNDDYPYRLICRRSNHFMNSVGQTLTGLAKGEALNPLYMHPADIRALGLEESALVRVRSARSEIVVPVEGDLSARAGVVSIYHGFDESSVSALISMEAYDPITGIPRMSGIPVRIERVEQG